MRIRYVGSCTVFVILLVCSVVGYGYGYALEDETLIRGLLSSFDIKSAAQDSDDNLVEGSANCRLKLVYLKRVYEELSSSSQVTPGTSTGFSPTDPKLIEEALKTLHPRIRRDLFHCLRENYPYRPPPISGEDVSHDSWYQSHLVILLPNSLTDAESRRHLAEAQGPAHPPAPAPSPNPSRSKRPTSKLKSPPPADTFTIPIPVPESSTAKDTEVADSTSKSSDHRKRHVTIISAVIATALVTFTVATILFCCCRRAFGRNSAYNHKDDRPLLSLSMTDYSLSGSSPKTWAYDNSVGKERTNSQSYLGSLSDKKGNVSLDGNFSSESTNEARLSGAAANTSSAQSSSLSSGTSQPFSALKPPPGRPPLRPPPGRANPMPPEPSASLRMSTAAPPPPTAHKAPAAPAAPPPPPVKKAGPPPPGPPPPPGKPGPRAPPPPKGGGPPRPPPVAVKSGSTSGKDDDNASKAKLKPFFWDKVMANPDQSMVWDQIKSGSFQFNEEMIESLFGYSTSENKTDKKRESASRDPAPQFIQLIDPKKAQNLSILLKALGVTTEEVRDALQEGNELPSELLETLLKMAPTQEEELKLRLFSGDISQLGPAERFLKVLVDIPFAFRRMEALSFMGTLQEEIDAVKETFITLEAACKELRSSRLFLKLLEAVLKTGNRMNVGTYRGGAQAFKLDTLLKLADVKGTDGKTTLLHFVVQEIIRSEGVRAVRAAQESKSMSSFKSEDLLEDFPDDSEDHYRSRGLQVVSGLGDQLENVRKVACLDADGLTGTIAKLRNSLLKAKNFLNNEMKDVEVDKGFHQALKSFVEQTEGDVMGLLEEEKRIMALVKSTADYFHGNSGKEEGLRLFIIVRDFLIMLQKVCREVKERPKWPSSRTQKRDPPSRQTSTETPRTPQTPASPDFRQRLFPAITERRIDGSSSSDDD